VLAVGLVAFTLFLRSLHYTPQTYYFIAPMALAAVLFDALVATLPGVLLRRFLVLCLAAGIGAAAFPRAWTSSRQPHTNLDQLAARLESAAAPRDLIVIIPWYSGTTFHRYYRGKTPWITIPELDDYTFQREDLFKHQLATTNASASALEKITRTLQSGNKLWLICQLDFVHPRRLPETLPPALPPAPRGPQGWFADPYLHRWAQETWHLLQRHAVRASDVMAPTPDVSQYEILPLLVFEGWK
jgi:hypothetical protein